MGELTLIYGPAHPDKASLASARCSTHLDAGDSRAFLWLFPSHFQAQLMRRQLSRPSCHSRERGNPAVLRDRFKEDEISCHSRGRGNPAPPRVLTGPLALDLNAFIDLLYSLCPGRRAALPLSAQVLLVEDALAASAASAPYYSRRPERLIRGLAQLFGRLEELGVEPSDLGGTTQRSAELQALYAAYLARLAAGWSGSRERFAAVHTHLDRSLLAQRFPGLKLLVLCGFVEVPAPFLPVLEKLLALVPESIAVLDYDPEGPGFFARTRPLYDWVRARAARVEFSAAEPHPVAAFANRLFAPSRARCAAPVERVPCPDRVGEVAAMARRIRQLHREQGVALGQIRMGFRTLNLYAELVAEVLPRHGLPFYLARGRPLATAPAMNAVFALLDAVLERYSRAALFRLLSLPSVCLRYAFAEQTNALSAADFAAWTRNVPPSTGRGAWLAAIDDTLAYIERELGREGEPVSEEIGDLTAWRESLRAESVALQPLRAGLTALFDLLQPLDRRQTLPSFRHNLLHALGALGVEDGAAADGHALTRFLDLLDELCAPVSAEQARTPSEFADLLRDAVSQAHIPATTQAGIQVTDLAAAGSAPCDYLLLGGLVQGEFPRVPPADIFLEESQRRALNLDEDATTEAERLLFYRAVSAPRRGLAVFYPQQAGREVLAPSPFITELDELLGPQPAADDADRPPSTPGELHRALGRGLCEARESDLGRDALALYGAATQLDGHATAQLVRGLHLAARRASPEGFGRYEGVLDEKPLLDALRTRLGAGHSFSATQLELYGRCPFRFFAQDLLGLQPLRDPEADDSALKRGNLVHRILYRFYTAHGEAAERRENLPTNVADLRGRGRQIAEEMRLTGFFWERELERLLGTDDGEREGILPRFLRLQADAPDPAVPTHFELSFGSYPGMGDGDRQSTKTPYAIGDPETGDEVRLSGKIDRIDRTADGRFMVFDYKTGRMPAVDDLKKETGLTLQLPLYVLAAESLFGELGLRQGAGAAYLMLRDLDDCGRKGLFADDAHRNAAYVARSRQYEHEEYRQRLDTVRGFVLSYARAMRRGEFRVTAHDPAKICPHCPYQQSCRLDPQRVRDLQP